MLGYSEEIKASEILHLLGKKVSPDDIIIVQTTGLSNRGEPVVYVEFLERYLDDEDISWMEFPIELWDDESPYPKTLAHVIAKKVETNFSRVGYLKNQIETIKEEILGLQKENVRLLTKSAA